METPKPVTTLEIVLEVVKIVRELGPALLMAVAELSRYRQRRAENQLAVVEAGVSAEKAKSEVDKRNEGKTTGQRIDDFLARMPDEPGAGAGS